MKITTFENIEKKLPQVLEYINYVETTNNNILFDDLREILDDQDYYTILEKYNSDVKKSAELLTTFFQLIQNKEQFKDDFDNKKYLLELEQKLNKMKQSDGSYKFGNISFTLDTNYNNLDLINIYIDNQKINDFFDIEDKNILLNGIQKYTNQKYFDNKKLTINKNSFNYNFNNIKTPQEYFNGLKKIPERIDLISKIQNFALNLNNTLSDIDNSLKNKDIKQIFSNRTRSTIRDTLSTSQLIKKDEYGSIETTLIPLKIKKNEKQEAKEQKNSYNQKIEDLIELFDNNVLFNTIEIDKDSSLQTINNLFKILEKENVSFNGFDQIGLKIRKLGNYNATGLKFDDQVAVDLSTPFSLIHELGHYIYDDIYMKSDELQDYAVKFTQNLALQMSNVPKNKLHYYFKNTEIFARAAEIAKMLKDINFIERTKDNPFSEEIFFTPEEIDNLKNLNQENNGLIKPYDFYFSPSQKGIYFNLEKMTINELTTFSLYFQDFLGFKDTIDLPFKDQTEKMTKTINKKIKEDSIKGIKINRGKQNPNLEEFFKGFQDFIYQNYEDPKENYLNTGKHILIDLIKENPINIQYTNINEFCLQFNNLMEDIFTQKALNNFEIRSEQRKLYQVKELLNKNKDLIDKELLYSDESKIAQDILNKEGITLKSYASLGLINMDLYKSILKLQKKSDTNSKYISKFASFALNLKRTLNYMTSDKLLPYTDKNDLSNIEIFKKSLDNILNQYIYSKNYIVNRNNIFKSDLPYISEIKEDFVKQIEEKNEITFDIYDNLEKIDETDVSFIDKEQEKKFLDNEIYDNEILRLTKDNKEFFVYKNAVILNNENEKKPNNAIKDLLVPDNLLDDETYKYFYTFRNTAYSNFTENDFSDNYFRPYYPLPKYHFSILNDIIIKHPELEEKISNQLIKIYPKLMQQFKKQLSNFVDNNINNIDPKNQELFKKQIDINLNSLKKHLDKIILKEDNPYINKNISDILNKNDESKNKNKSKKKKKEQLLLDI